jgi:hypothetical protein
MTKRETHVEQVSRVLTPTDGQTRADIARKTGLSVQQTSTALVHLREKGLAYWRRTPNNFLWFRA